MTPKVNAPLYFRTIHVRIVKCKVQCTNTLYAVSIVRLLSRQRVWLNFLIYYWKSMKNMLFLHVIDILLRKPRYSVVNEVLNEPVSTTVPSIIDNYIVINHY